uniref:Uncharacterized protein n=1 Tax=viral metagenome TaxID=1070528 RepID=A0A6M3LDX3_9ZZZZ
MPDFKMCKTMECKMRDRCRRAEESGTIPWKNQVYFSPRLYFSDYCLSMIETRRKKRKEHKNAKSQER